MAQVKALVITGYGTNCEMEMAYACRQAGALCDIVHISDIIHGTCAISDYHFLNLAGGFLDGDDIHKGFVLFRNLTLAGKTHRQGGVKEKKENKG